MQKLAEAERLLGLKKSAEALDILKAVDIAELSASQKSFHDILLAEAGMILADYSLTSGLDAAIETFRFDPDTAKFAKAKYLKGWLLVIQGEYAQAQEVLLESYSNYLRCQQLEGAARAINRTAHVSLRLGDTDSAIESLGRSRDIYKRLGNRLHWATVSNNLAYTYALTGRLRNSLAEFEATKEVLKKLSPLDRLHYWLGAALAHALRCDKSEARENLELCIPYLDKLPYQKALYHEFSGWIAFLEEDFSNAETMFSQYLKMSGGSTASSPSDLLRPKRLLGEVYVATERWQKAQATADEVCQAATAYNDRAEMAGCYRIYARIENHRKNREAARRWFSRTVDLFGLIKYRYEVAVTQYAAARSGLYNDQERDKLSSRAADYFKSENIAPYLKKVNAEMSGLRRSLSAPVVLPKSRPAAAVGPVECPDIITGSATMRELLALAERVATSNLNVFITGETGTGKDLMAKYIHYHSQRTGRFISVNAAAVPDSMVESEMFGYAKGAFTGADRDKPGLLEAADGGTFFLDEIADASSSFQAKLLEAIENRRIRRLGDTSERPADFRLITATNQDLEPRLETRQFRADLYHRLNEFLVHLPPLRDRAEDFLPLTEYFLRTSGLDPHEDGNRRSVQQLSEVLSERPWPGNVRQLRAEINYLVLVSDRDISRMVTVARQSDRRSEEYQRLLRALEGSGGNQSLAARKLGIPESTFRYRLAKHRIKPGK